jgi:hypothetical protein
VAANSGLDRMALGWTPKLLVGVVIGSLVLLTACGQTSTGSSDTSHAETAVLMVSDIPVTAEDLERNQEAVRSNLDYMENTLAEWEDEGHADIPQQYLDAWITLLRDTGPDAAGLGAAIGDAAVFDFGVRNGLEVTSDEIEAKIEDQREILEEARPHASREHQALMAAMDDDEYWTDHMPAIIEQDLMTRKVQDFALNGVNDPEVRSLEWAEFTGELAEEADIEVLDSSIVSDEDLDAAIAYITEDYVELREQWANQ